MKTDGERIDTGGADLLRGVAIILVVMLHCFGSCYGWYVPWKGWSRDFGGAGGDTLLRFYPLTLGWAGVALFFVISGFCIHLSFLRGGFDPRRFFWKRFWRIYPAYLAALMAFSVVIRPRIWTPEGALHFASHALFLHNLSGESFFSINGSFWSIATEMQLYLLFPALLLMRARLGIERCLGAIFAVGLAWRALVIGLFGLPDHLIDCAWSSPLMTWFDWSLGAFVAERMHSGGRVFRRPAAWLALALPCFVASTLYKPATSFSFTLAALVSAVVLEVSVHVRWPASAWVGALRFIGLISYSIYLWHQPLIRSSFRRLEPIVGPPLAWIAFGSALVAGAWLSYRLLELPGIELGKKLWKRLACRARPAPISPVEASGASQEPVAYPGAI